MTRIGNIGSGNGVRVIGRDGCEITLRRAGYRHFRLVVSMPACAGHPSTYLEDPNETIIAAVDLSEPSLRAVDLSADLANKYDAELVLLTVGHDITRTRSWDGGLREDGTQTRAHAYTPHRFNSRRTNGGPRPGSERGARRISTEVFIGEPAAEILASASAGQADLIVMGSRGHGRLTGLLLGSVAQKVVALACCPVIVVHSILCPGAFPSRPTILRQTARLDHCEHREPWQPPGA